MGQVRQLQRDCAGLLVELAQVADDHASQGHGLPAEDVLLDQDSVTAATAAADVARAQIAARFPSLGAAIRAGLARPENVDVLARTAAGMTDDEVDVLTQQDTALAEAAGRLGMDSFRRRVHRARDRIRADHGRTAAEQVAAETCARVSLRRDRQAYTLWSVLEPLDGAAAAQALAAETRRLADNLGADHGLGHDQPAARALADLIVRGAATAPTEDNTRPVVHLDVLTDGRTLADGPHDDTIAETADGVPLTPGTIGRLACDCIIRRIESLPDGRVNVSRSARTATAAQRAALRALYPGCPLSGAPWSHIEIHHVVPRSQDGEAVLSNLVPISRRWHHVIHDEGWRLEMDGDRTLRLYRPDGQLDRTVAPPEPVVGRREEVELAA